MCPQAVKGTAARFVWICALPPESAAGFGRTRDNQLGFMAAGFYGGCGF